MKKLIVVFILLLFFSSVALAGPKIEIFMQTLVDIPDTQSILNYTDLLDKVVWHRLDFLYETNYYTSKRAGDVAALLVTKGSYKVEITWDYKDDLGKTMVPYYFNKMSDVYIFTTLLSIHKAKN